MLIILFLLFSHPVVSNSLRPHGLKHARPPCPSPSPEVCPSSCPSYWWCPPAISSSDALFSFCPQSFQTSGTFPKSWLFTLRWPKYWSFSFSSSPSNEYLGLISFKIHWFDPLAVEGTLKSLRQHRNSKAMHYSLPQIIQSSMGRKRPSCFPVVSRSLLYSSEKKVTFIFA